MNWAPSGMGEGRVGFGGFRAQVVVFSHPASIIGKVRHRRQATS